MAWGRFRAMLYSHTTTLTLIRNIERNNTYTNTKTNTKKPKRQYYNADPTSKMHLLRRGVDQAHQHGH